jgi:hypothetical protein
VIGDNDIVVTSIDFLQSDNAIARGLDEVAIKQKLPHQNIPTSFVVFDNQNLERLQLISIGGFEFDH